MSVSPPTIPDYTLLRCIGRGAYGEVWLGRGVTGLHRAVKIVYRSGFSEATPYEREFSGIKRFQAISHTQENLVNILHVGRNDDLGYFFYVMELADPAAAVGRPGGEPSGELARVPGSDLDTTGYQSATLKYLLRTTGRMPVARCLVIGKGLARAIDHLHRQGLIHRDIKPSNVIFVNGVPKLADIGLVAGMDESRSFVGTEGFVPPDGPGTVAADIYAFGRLLYEMSSGRDRKDYPRLPEDFDALDDRAALVEFNEIVLKAGDPEPQRRYGSADEVVRDLLLLEAGKSVRRLRLLETRFALAWRATGVATLVTLVMLAGWLWAHFQAREARQNYEQSERHRRAAESALREVLLNQVRANRLSGWVGQRLESLRMLRENPSITNNLTFRSEALACLALPDARVSRSIALPRAANSGARIALDQQLTVYVTNDASGTVVMRSIDDDTIVRILPTPGAGVARFAYSPDDRYFGVTYQDRTFAAWNLARWPAQPGAVASTWEELPESIRPKPFRLPDGATGALFVPGTGEIATHDLKGQLHFFQATSGAPTRVVSLDLVPNGLTLDPSGVKLCAVRSNDCAIFRLGDSARLFTFTHPARVSSARWHPDGRHLATTCFDFRVRVWDTVTGQQLSAFGDHESEVIDLAFDTSGTLLASASWDSTTRLWSPGSGRPLVRLKGSGNNLRLSADGTRLAYTSWLHDQLVLTELLPGRERVTLERVVFGRGGGTYGLTFSPDGRFVVASDSEQTQIWQWPFFNPAAYLPVIDCATPAFSPAGDRLITVSYGEAAEWAFRADATNGLLHLGPRREIISRPASSQWAWHQTPDGTFAAFLYDQQVRFLAREGDQWKPAFKLDGKARHISFAGNRGWIGLAPSEVQFDVIDRQGRAVTNFACADSKRTTFSADGRWLFLVMADRYQAIDVETWQPGPAVPHTGLGTKGTKATGFAAGSSLAALRTDERQLTLIDLETWEVLAWFPIPQATTAVALSPDGSMLGVATEKTGIEVWDVARVRDGLRSMGLDWASREPRARSGAPATKPFPRSLRPNVQFDPPRSTNESPVLAARLPARDPGTPTACLDLSSYYNGSLHDGWIPGFKLGTTAEHNLPIPAGVNRLAGIDFDVRGVVQLASTTLASRQGKFPDLIRGIPVGRHCRRIHFLHGTDWRGKDGTVIGGYAVRYRTGEEELIWTTYGRDVVDWWLAPPADAGTNGPVVAWTGSNVASRRQNCSIRVYCATWTNPRWDLPVESIDFGSFRTATGPFLLAITVE